MEKVSRFDRKTLRGVHRLFRGVHFVLGGCKRQRGCNLNDRGTLTNWNLSMNSLFRFVRIKHDLRMERSNQLPVRFQC